MRITRHQMFQEIAQVVAKRSTCFREAVGAIVVKNDRVISMGYNGPKAGAPHCTHHPDGQCTESIHAEDNAIRFLKGKAMINCDLYCTHLPCPRCTYLITSSGYFSRVFFSVVYGDVAAIEEAFNSAGIKLYRILPSGVITTPDRKVILNDVE